MSVLNPDFVSEYKTVKEPLQLVTNGSILTTYNKTQVSGFREVWYDDNAIINIFSFSEIEDKYRIIYDSAIKKAFKVYLPNKIIKFRRSDKGLYYAMAHYIKRSPSKNKNQ